MLPGECLVLIYVKRINMQEPTGTALDSLSLFHSIQIVKEV